MASGSVRSLETALDRVVGQTWVRGQRGHVASAEKFGAKVWKLGRGIEAWLELRNELGTGSDLPGIRGIEAGRRLASRCRG